MPTTTAPSPSVTPEAVAIGKKIPYTGKPTENPNDRVIPGKMRSDREEIPEGYTKEDADKAEIAEAKRVKERRLQRSTLAALAPTDCMTYWPAWQYQVCGLIRVKYDSLGGPTSFLLLPTSNELTNPDGHGKRSLFQNGPIYWSAATGAHPVLNHFMMKWGQYGWEGGWLGYPTSDEIVLQNGRRQEFQPGAAIYWSPASLGIVGGAIRTKYNALGAETGPLGYPSSDEAWVTKYNGRNNNFLNGTITWSGNTGARVLYSAVRDRWAEFGREDGVMGYPTSDEQVAPDGQGHFVRFEDQSAIYWYPVVGAWRIPKEVLAAFQRMGFETGNLGYPSGPARATTSIPGTFQEFAHGALMSKANPNNTFDYRVIWY